jgi:hypothetical protein
MYQFVPRSNQREPYYRCPSIPEPFSRSSEPPQNPQSPSSHFPGDTERPRLSQHIAGDDMMFNRDLPNMA